LPSQELPKKQCWLNPEESTGDLFKGVNLGGRLCWEAKGQARKSFESLAPEIKKHLDEKCDSVAGPVTWTIYLIGFTRESSPPTIMFCGPNKSARNYVRKTVDESGLLDKYPGMETGSWAREFRHLAGGKTAISGRFVPYDVLDMVKGV
jgi:hypothetical protein